jgi:hypothetical protein
MLIEIDDSYVEWLKEWNPDLFAPGQDAKAVVEEFANEVLSKHRESWMELEEE